MDMHEAVVLEAHKQLLSMTYKLLLGKSPCYCGCIF
jgi:hypothetical protein